MCSNAALRLFVTARWSANTFVDLMVEGSLLVDLKTVKALDAAHRAQCVNYLKATGLQLCLLLNFGRSRLEVRRVALGL